MADKSHRKKKTGRKAEKRKTAVKKKASKLSDADLASARVQNPKAFAFNSAGRAQAQRARTAEQDQKRLHAPVLERDNTEPPPFVVLVQGPPQVGKSTLIKCLVKHYTRQNLNDVKGPITVVAGKRRRLTFVECPNEMNSMIDAAKYADLVLMLIDGSFGFEMETFEFLNLLQVHGFPKVMGVLTHLDSFKDSKHLRRRKKTLKARFWTEIYAGAKLFYLSGIQYGKYLKREILNLARFISVSKFRPLSWRLQHPFVLADRFEDVTPMETVRQNPKADRDVTLYGFLRGTNLRHHSRVHVAGVGDFNLQELDQLPDPCPLPDPIKRRGLNERERLLYAPFADLGGLLYDKDAVYIDIPDWKVQFSKDGTGKPGGEVQSGEQIMQYLQETRTTVDEKLQGAKIQLFPRGQLLEHKDLHGTNCPSLMDEDGSWREDDDDLMDEGDEDDASDQSHADEDEGDVDAKDDYDSGCGEAGGRPGCRQEAVVELANGRVRRRAIFWAEGGKGGGDGAGRVEADEKFREGETDSDEEVDNILQRRWGSKSASTGGDDASDRDGEDEEEQASEEGLGGAGTWKSQLLQRAAALFSNKTQELQRIVYGQKAVSHSTALHGEANGGGGNSEGLLSMFGGCGNDDDGEEEDDNSGEFFKVKQDGRTATKGRLDMDDAEDSSLVLPPMEQLTCWENSELVELLRSRFVTGDWEDAGKRSKARPTTDRDEDEDEDDGSDDNFGGFEDVEMAQIVCGGDAVTAAARKAIDAAAMDVARQKKFAKKSLFDSKYDEGNMEQYHGEAESEEDGGIDACAADHAGGSSKKKHKGGRIEKEETYFDAVKRDLASKAAETKALLSQLDVSTRQELEGFLPGAYVRIRLTGVPFELVTHLDSRFPLLLGGLSQGEEGMGMMKLRFKRHRWSPRILKAQDPLVFSCGWRRFQSLPVYASEDHNRRLRMLKYTPEHMHCIATIYGPLAPPGTGVVAVQNLSTEIKNWRISATGVVTELDTGTQIMKKLKLVGTPVKIHRHTAFVSGMFTSQLEAAKFEGAAIRTASGMRGAVKKALRPGLHGVKDGAYRATFEDKPLMSDLVFLRAWVAVEVPHFCNPVTNMLSQHQPLPVRPRKTGHTKQDGEKGPEQDDVLSSEPAQLALPGPEDSANIKFQSCSRFAGKKEGCVFKSGSRGLGYYADTPLTNRTSAAGHVSLSAHPSTTPTPQQGLNPPPGIKQEDGWVGMRTLAQLRAALGVGAPRRPDSMYRPIERAARKFNSLKVPKTLQAALPFRSKPKLEAPYKRKTLEQKRAVVLEPHEKKVATMVQQLNAIRNEKRKKRKEQHERHKEKVAKEVVKAEQWQMQLQKEQRKKRYRAEGMVDKAKQHVKYGYKKQKSANV